MIELNDVRYWHDGASRDAQTRFTLHVPRLTIERGQRVACIGPSGSGKTTLLHLIAGVLAAKSGFVRVLGQDLSSLSDMHRRGLRMTHIGMMFQEFELLEYVSAIDNILLIARLTSASEDAARARALRLAERCGLQTLLKRKPAELSQGERQRVALCRALAPQPAIILCDEPTGNLDPSTGGRVLDVLFEQAERSRATVLMATHDHQILPRFDRVLDMSTLVHLARNEVAA